MGEAIISCTCRNLLIWILLNENDTTAREEIKFGDDKLSFLTAVLLDVDLLILASNIYGLYEIIRKL